MSVIKYSNYEKIRYYEDLKKRVRDKLKHYFYNKRIKELETKLSFTEKRILQDFRDSRKRRNINSKIYREQVDGLN